MNHPFVTTKNKTNQYLNTLMDSEQSHRDSSQKNMPYMVTVTGDSIMPLT